MSDGSAAGEEWKGEVDGEGEGEEEDGRVLPRGEWEGDEGGGIIAGCVGGGLEDEGLAAFASYYSGALCEG